MRSIVAPLNVGDSQNLRDTNELAQPPVGPIATFACGVFIIAGVALHFGTFDSQPAMIYLTALIPLGVLLLLPVETLKSITVAIPAVLLTGWTVLSAAWTADAERTIFLLRTEVPIVLGFMLVAAILHEADFFRFLLWGGRAVLLITLAATALSPSSRIDYLPGGAELPGWHGFFEHKNEMGPFFVLFIAMVLIIDKRPWTRWPSLAGALILVAGSQSITALSALLVVLGAYGWLTLNRRADSRLLAATTMSTVVLLAASAFGIRAGLPLLLEATGKDPTFSGRTDIWAAVWELSKEHIWIGHGRGGVFFVPANDETLTLWQSIGFRANHEHNGVLASLVQLGIVGLGLVLAIFWSTIRSAIRSYRRHEDFGLFALVIAIAVLSISLSEPVFVGPYATFMIALSVIGLKLDRRQRITELATLARGVEPEPQPDFMAPNALRELAAGPTRIKPRDDG